MSVTAAKGFRAAGVVAGLKPSGSPDLALVVNDGPLDVAAGVFTTNRFTAAPVVWSRGVIAGEQGRRGAARARESASRSRTFFLVDDLAGLRRGGRVDRTTALMGGALGIRPVLAMSAAGITVAETVRGSARARRHLIAQAVRAAGGTHLSGPRPPVEPVRLAVHYGDDPARGRQLENDVTEAMARAGALVESVMRSPVDAAHRVHLGPGALGIAIAPWLGRGR